MIKILADRGLSPVSQCVHYQNLEPNKCDEKMLAISCTISYIEVTKTIKRLQVEVSEWFP